ncbi:Fizzy- protein, partial [Podochytrium sp. JEL0797]
EVDGNNSDASAMADRELLKEAQGEIERLHSELANVYSHVYFLEHVDSGRAAIEANPTCNATGREKSTDQVTNLQNTSSTHNPIAHPTIPSNTFLNPIPSNNDNDTQLGIQRSASLCPAVASHAHQRTYRSLTNKSPYMVLNAPKLKHDYCSNLVDWSRKNFLSVGLGNCVYLWDVASSRGAKLCDLAIGGAEQTRQGDAVTSVSWNPSGNLLAVGTKNGLLHIYDASTSTRLYTLHGHTSRVGSIAWSSIAHLTTGSGDGTFCLRDLRFNGNHLNGVVMRIATHRGEVSALKWALPPTPDKYLASGGIDKMLVWDHRMLSDPVHTQYSAVTAIAWSPHRSYLLASGGGRADKYVRFWDGQVGGLLNRVNLKSQVFNLAWSPEVDEIVTTHGERLDEDGALSENRGVVSRVSNGADGKTPQLHATATLTGHTAPVLHLAVSPNNQNVVTGGVDE